MFTRFRSVLRALRHGDSIRRELDEEMAFHLERLAEDLMLQGMSPDDARREARRRFGHEERVHEHTRRALDVGHLDEMTRNLRFAWRTMVRSPLLSVAFVLTLGLCIGFGTAVFSAADAVLWKPLPYPAADRLALAGLHDPSRGAITGRVGVDAASWIRIRDEAEGFRSAVYSGWVKGVNLSTDERARYVMQQRVSTGFFATLGVSPLLGRGFTPDEDVPDGPARAVLSYELWHDVFGADPEILGGTVRLKGELHTVVGIMPEGFRTDAEVDVWTPLRPSTSGAEGGGVNYTALVRLPAGMTWEEAEARFAAIETPRTDSGDSDLRFGLVPLQDALTSGSRLPLLVLVAAVALMLLVGCANLAGIQVSRAIAREVEMSTRQALGSGTGALVRQLVAENLLLGLTGGIVGLGIAVLSVGGLQELLRLYLGTTAALRIDTRALVVSMGLTGLATLLFGLVPVLHVRRGNALRVLVSGTRGVAGGGRHVARRLLLVAQVATVTVLLFSAGLLARSYGHLASLDPGFDARSVRTVQLSLDDARYATADAVNRLFETSLDGLRGLPDVTHAAVALSLPYERPLNVPFRLEGDADEGRPRLTNLVYVTPGFFEALEIPLREGRVLGTEDRADTPPVVIANQAFVDAHLEGRAALGTRVPLGLGGAPLEVVGVVGDVQQGGGGWGSSQPVWAAPTLYVPAAQWSDALFQQVHIWFSPSWIIRAPNPSPQLMGEITRVFAQEDSELPVARAAALEDVMAGAFAQSRFQAVFLIVVAIFSALLAGVGLYGIVAQEVLRRRREMGVRMALGVSPIRAVLTTGLAGVRLAAWGLLAGGLGAVLTGRVLTSLLWGVSPADPVTIVALVAGVGLLASSASFIPAARIGRLNPARVLRE